ncbi:enoyl-CoA hydratase/isomerase family protein [Roseivirga thermotolerans]|jgi:enoyl-CoA hydratase|uniref:Enoyl-CoA hydratase n=1 Tax=Roseivirga thermotolerans TaxID=1758176 RepID=A0ABQ3I2N3_9BACT|nr:enoyl-CoA hydratase-related protein [Roseivirga thermotolerans]GHE59014.1 enoyl-CoA hydratase [Roseivirga thermotolerans]
MTAFSNILFENKEGIVYLTINRPDKMNALNAQTIDEIKLAFETIYDDNSIRGVVIAGAGDKAFVAGADISEIASLSEVNARKFAESGQEVFAAIENCHKPVIALVNGFALGGGCELAMACHMRVATATAKFGQPEVKLGIIPGYGGTQRLTQLVGKAKAFELCMTADMIGAEEAKSLGLANHVVNTIEEGKAKCEEILGKIASKAPIAIGLVIDCVNAVFNEQENGYQTEANSFAACTKTADFKEGTTAFLEKRPATFKGE